MDAISNTEAWRQIPPEEKIDLMTDAQSSGVASGAILIILGAVFAVGYQQPIIFWSALIGSPIAYQFSASKKWRALRPRIMLEYLAVRSAARRYAYAVKSVDMSVRLVLRGTMQFVPSADHEHASLDSAITGFRKINVWITLFSDCVILVSEAKGGAKLEFGHLINDRFSLSTGDQDLDDLSEGIFLSYDDRRHGMHTILLKSTYPAALAAFTAQLQEYIKRPRVNRFDESLSEELPAEA